MKKYKITIRNLADQKLTAMLYCMGNDRRTIKKNIRFRRSFKALPGHYELEVFYKNHSTQLNTKTIGLENTSVNTMSHGAYTRSRIVFKKLNRDYLIECDAKISVSDVLSNKG